MEHHFVVVYDSVAGKFTIDGAMTDAAFGSDSVWDPNLEEWSSFEDVSDIEEFANNKLQEALDKINV